MTSERSTDRPFQRNLLKAAALVAVGGGVAMAILVDMGLSAHRSLAETADSPCLVDPADQVHKRCTEFLMGGCRQFTTSCEP